LGWPTLRQTRDAATIFAARSVDERCYAAKESRTLPPPGHRSEPARCVRYVAVRRYVHGAPPCCPSHDGRQRPAHRSSAVLPHRDRHGPGHLAHKISAETFPSPRLDDIGEQRLEHHVGKLTELRSVVEVD